MRPMLVIGLGHFGSNLARKLTELGNEVMAVDIDEELVNKIAPFVTRAQIGDCMEIEVLQALDVRSFDVCFVCISDNFQSSLEITSLLKELGARCVISKTDREIQAKFLRKIGADEVIYPERDMAQRTAVKYSIANAFEYYELTPEYAILEIAVPGSWVGKSIRSLNVRTAHHINIIGVKRNGQMTPITNPDYVFIQEEHLVAAGSKSDLLQLLKKN
ncbi:MAG: TrkA family potassium uptake protein [Negativicutes bacterium]|nr:TrkA family potassium uptake protein [Negativicutes bacterium]